VKIGVRFPEEGEGTSGERFWVEVTHRAGDQFVGQIKNELMFTEVHGLQLDDEIQFHTRNVLDTDTFDYLVAVDYEDADNDEAAQLTVGVAGRYARIWLAVGEEQIGTALGPGHRELDDLIRVLSEARARMVRALGEKSDA
jgi:hypothetical protein